MAIAPTGAIYKALTFDGTSSRNYGVYITGEAVYNAPQRDVEMISIPGRNGAFALDKGRFENIEVTYPAGIFADTETNFADAISEFRNFLCSRDGYVRLTDEYNPNEYRMAVYKSGLEVEPAMLKAGQFNITFECMPQRWLTSGETKVTVTDGDTITNPTLFASSPMLEVEGYGTIGFNGYEIELDNAVLGNIKICPKEEWVTEDKTISLDDSLLNNGDEITIGKITLRIKINVPAISTPSVVVTDSNTDFTSTFVITSGSTASSTCTVTTELPSFAFDKGDTETKSNTVTITGTAHSQAFSVTCNISINASSNTISVQRTITNSGHVSSIKMETSSIEPCIGYSTMPLLGHPTYIDCDLGEAYRIDGDTITSLNQHIDLGSDLPTLASGANTITYDNTITDLKITPRWWKV